MKRRLNRKPNMKAVIALFVVSSFIAFTPAINYFTAHDRTLLATQTVSRLPASEPLPPESFRLLTKTLLTDSSTNDDATLHSPEMDSFLLIVAITVLGLTSAIGYYIITRRKGPH